ncbi:MAG: 23S rRNA pseudouridine(1911/1915/1917) synthase RluD [Gammaproteobacteria bacterium]
MERVRLTAEIPANLAGSRIDQALAVLFADYSRARLQQWIRAGEVTVDGRVPRPRDRVAGHETVQVDAVLDAHQPCRPQPIPLDIVYEDSQLMVVNKPAGLVVHPAAGNVDGTLQNALLHHAPALAVLPRAGIVHRLDKDTSGLMVVARTLAAHKSLVAQLAARTVKREYEAIANGTMTAGGSVDAPIGRHPVDRKRMAVVDGGKPAVTHYRVVERFRAHTWLRVNLETGRTHQIRVHLAHIRHPLVGDPVYGGRLRIPSSSTEALAGALRGFRRQALHAGRLALAHPATGEQREWQAPPPADMLELLAALRRDRDRHDQD